MCIGNGYNAILIQSVSGINRCIGTGGTTVFLNHISDAIQGIGNFLYKIVNRFSIFSVWKVGPDIRILPNRIAVCICAARQGVIGIQRIHAKIFCGCLFGIFQRFGGRPPQFQIDTCCRIRWNRRPDLFRTNINQSAIGDLQRAVDGKHLYRLIAQFCIQCSIALRNRSVVNEIIGISLHFIQSSFRCRFPSCGLIPLRRCCLNEFI